MIEISKDISLIKRQNHDGDTWVCQQLFPVDTWKNRKVWKPVTRPLNKTEVCAWLAQQHSGADMLEQFCLAADH